MALKAETAVGVKESDKHTKEDRHKKQSFSVSNERGPGLEEAEEVLTSGCNVPVLNIYYEQNRTKGTTRGGK